MRTITRNLTALIASAGAGAAILLAPVAAADPPDCSSSPGGVQTTGTQTTLCQSPGNVQLNATAPSVPVWSYPWDDEFYGAAMIIGPGEPPRGGGGYGPHR
jgi:hypothetical protein